MRSTVFQRYLGSENADSSPLRKIADQDRLNRGILFLDHRCPAVLLETGFLRARASGTNLIEIVVFSAGFQLDLLRIRRRRHPIPVPKKNLNLNMEAWFSMHVA